MLASPAPRPWGPHPGLPLPHPTVRSQGHRGACASNTSRCRDTGTSATTLVRVQAGQGTDPRLWLPWESRSSSPSSMLAAFFSLLLFFCAEGERSQAPWSPWLSRVTCTGRQGEGGRPAIRGSWFPSCQAGPAGPLQYAGRPGPRVTRGIGWCGPGEGHRGLYPGQPQSDQVARSPEGDSRRQAQGPGSWRGCPGWPAQGQLGKREDGAWWAPARCPRLGAPPDLEHGEAAHKDAVVPSAGPGVLPGLHILLSLGERETEVTVGDGGDPASVPGAPGTPPARSPEAAGAGGARGDTFRSPPWGLSGRRERGSKREPLEMCCFKPIKAPVLNFFPVVGECMINAICVSARSLGCARFRKARAKLPVALGSGPASRGDKCGSAPPKLPLLASGLP